MAFVAVSQGWPIKQTILASGKKLLLPKKLKMNELGGNGGFENNSIFQVFFFLGEVFLFFPEFIKSSPQMINGHPLRYNKIGNGGEIDINCKEDEGEELGRLLIM